MPYHLCDLRQFVYESPDGKRRGLFRPNGPVCSIGKRLNPVDEWDSNTFSARVFLGFNVGEDPVWSMDQVVEWVKNYRASQLAGGTANAKPDASFIYQRGVFTHSKPGDHEGKIVTENSTQIVFLNVDENEPEAVFKRNILQLAQAAVYFFKQEQVFVDFQRNGISIRTASVSP